MTALLGYAAIPAGPVHAQAAGCLALETGTVTVVGSTTTVRPSEAPCGVTSVQLTAARNEFESSQIVIRAAGAGLTTVNVAAGALTGPGGATIAASNITIYREALYTVVTRSDGEGALGEWPDALIPDVDPWYREKRNAFPVNVPATQNRVAWIDVFVPKTATPGAYTGTVTVSSAGGSVQVPVSLRVLNTTLPSTSSLQNLFLTNWKEVCVAHTGNFYCNYDETQRWSLHALYAQAALDNRLTISNPVPMGVDSGPSAAQAAQFKTFILPMLRPDVTAFHNKWRAPRLQGAEMTSVVLYWHCGVNCLTSWKNLALTAPTFGDKVILYCVDEPGDSAALWDTCRTSVSNAANAWPGLPALVTADIQHTTKFGMEPSIDILVPAISRMHGKDFQTAAEFQGNQRSKYDSFLTLAGTRLWMYTACGSFSCDGPESPLFDGWAGYAIDQPASQSRAMGWLSFTYNTTGELYWETTYKLAAAWAPNGMYESGGNGDGTLFYPGTPAVIGGTTHIPVESIRLKRIRDGREDYEYLQLLAGKGQRAEAMQIATQLFPSLYQTTVTQAALDAARASLISKLESLAGPTPTPTMSLDRTSLRFAATTSGTAFSSQTGRQTVRLTQGAGPAVTWTATSSRPWLTVTPASGTGSAALSISVKFDASLPASGTTTGAITFALTGASNTVGPINVPLTVVSSTAAVSPPFGSFDTPVGDLSVLAGSVPVTGWILDNIGVKQVEIWRDLQAGETTPPYGGGFAGDPRAGKVFIANGVFSDGARSDIEGLYPTTPANYRAGWGYLMLTWGLFGQGNGTYKLYVFGVDQEGNTATIGSKSLIVRNNTATKPFGSIDTPGIGGDASGPNFGWGLTPRVNGAATCKIQASGVQYSVDSGPLQPVVYGSVRPDIAGAFVGFSNAAAAGGHAIIDWNTLTNGAHSIGWLITDDCGRADGVGSRFFNVTTGTNLVARPVDPLVSGQVVAETESDAPITVSRGYGELPAIVDPQTAGSRTVEMQQGDRIELRVPRGFESVYQLGPNGQRRALPIGSTWDEASGTFYWQPSPGFLGRYRLVFSNGRERISVRIVVVP